MKISRVFFIFCLLLAFCFSMTQCQMGGLKSRPHLTGNGTGINSVTLMVQDIDSTISYFKDTLGFNIRGRAREGLLKGTLTANIRLADMSSLELLSVIDSVKEDSVPAFIRSFSDSHEGIRLFSLSSSSVDSTSMALTNKGFQMDSVQLYESSMRKPEGWSWETPQQKSLDFNISNPPAHLPRFIERFGYDYEEAKNDWKTNYGYGRVFGKHPNGVVGTNSIRVVVKDLKTKTKEFKKMGFEVVEQTDDITRFRMYKHQEIYLVAARNQEQKDFLATRGEGVFAMRYNVENLDSTIQYLEEALTPNAMTKTPELLTIPQEYAFGVQLEFVEESEEQGVLARMYSPTEELDSLAIANVASLYSKYCALCHGENREGYAADNAPSLRSKSLLATSKNNNFMRYTIQYGRANTAMAGYFNKRGGPMEYIEIELMLQWLNEMANVEEPIELSREPVLGDIEIGATVYKTNCAVCHGENGEGVSAPALGNPMTLATATDHFLRYAIAEGRDSTPMIAFKDSLSSEEIDGVVAFLRSRASGWDIPKPDTVNVPTPEEYVLNPDGEDPVFDLREDKYVSAEKVNQAFSDGQRMIILDARSEVAWRQMHIPGAVPVPYYEEPENFIDDIPNDGTQIVIYCACPHAASGRVLGTLRRYGYENTAIIDEGILVWAQLGFPVRNGG